MGKIRVKRRVKGSGESPTTIAKGYGRTTNKNQHILPRPIHLPEKGATIGGFGISCPVTIKQENVEKLLHGVIEEEGREIDG